MNLRFVVKTFSNFHCNLFCRIMESVKSVDDYTSKCTHLGCSFIPDFMRLVGKIAASTLRHFKTGNGSHLDRYVRFCFKPGR